MSDWWKDELARHLGPVRAPDALWERIQNGRQAERLPRRQWARWAIAAVVALAAVIGTNWLPSPDLRADVVVLAASHQPDPRADDPSEWGLRCAPPAGPSAFRVTNVSARRGHQFELAATGPEDGVIGCQACHSVGLGQHHL
ncbi:MAG TPA: hypothetical protein VKT49_19705 [Bryobacteraceae bacterium]|nr:hypothetical protein [Bryobacteraceae bacterium]